MFRQTVRKEGRKNLHLQILILDQYVDSIRYEYGRIGTEGKSSGGGLRQPCGSATAE